jgi:maltose alpha-D-glucosyltransferase / alpha-amylase
MQWSAEPGGGFSSAAKDGLTPYLISTGDYGHERVNLDDQRRDAGSLVNWIRATIEARRKLPEIGRGRLVLLETDSPRVFAHACEWQGRRLAAVHNLASEPCAFRVNGLDGEIRDDSLPRDRDYGELDPSNLALGPYGYRWLQLGVS